MKKFENELQEQINQILEKIKEDDYLIGISGYPGSGKTFIADKLQKQLKNCVIIGMDGYHFYRKDLDEKGRELRGAEFTIDLKRMEKDLKQLKVNKKGSFPSFMHEDKDPQENSIIVEENTKHVIVEGLYIFLKQYNMNELFDFKIFINCKPEVIQERLIERHIQWNLLKLLTSKTKSLEK